MLASTYSGIGNSPFTKITGVGFLWQPAVQLYTARNGVYRCWQVTTAKAGLYDPERSYNAASLITETQNLTYTSVNNFYDIPNTPTGRDYPLSQIETPEIFEVDYVICALGMASIYGVTDAGNQYAPSHSFFTDNEYKVYNESLPMDDRIHQDYIHAIVPDEFKSYTLLKTSSNKHIWAFTLNGNIIYSTKVTAPIRIEVGRGNVIPAGVISDELRNDLLKIFSSTILAEGCPIGDAVISEGIYIVVPMSYLGYGADFSIATQQALTMETPIEVTIDLQKSIVDTGEEYEYGNTELRSTKDGMTEAPFGAKIVFDPSILR